MVRMKCEKERVKEKGREGKMKSKIKMQFGIEMKEPWNTLRAYFCVFKNTVKLVQDRYSRIYWRLYVLMHIYFLNA